MKPPFAGIIAAAALLLPAGSHAASPANQRPQPFTDFETIVLEQSASLFDFPVFKVEIFSDGRVRHSGPTFEQTGGPHEARIDRRGLTQIARALREARVDEMRDRYQDEADGCENMMTDLYTLSMSVNRGEGAQDKRVVLYAGCLGPTVPTGRIDALSKAIGQVTGTGALLAQRERLRRPNGRR
jgi:hypothetical protein